jgi:uncharacterized tellurite resistance protein B-like protein
MILKHCVDFGPKSGNMTDIQPQLAASAEEAFIGLLASAVAADGKFMESELQLIQLITTHHVFMKNAPSELVDNMIARVRQHVLHVGPKESLNYYATSLPIEWRGAAFMCVLDLIYIDGETHAHEEEFTARLAEKFEMPPDSVEYFRSIFREKNGIIS